LVPLRVGLITSVGSAAYADFMDELARSGYAWRIGVFDARVQGVDAASDVTRGLTTLSRSGVDVVAVIRGGGAQTDLAVFDSEAIAVAIANCEVPVLTGIGHEIDVSVADLVARSFKTPTACAAGLVALIADFAGKIDQLAAGTRRAVRSCLALEASNLGHTVRRVARSAVAAGARAGQHLADAEARIARGSGSRLTRDAAGLDRLHERIGRASSRQVAMARHELDRLAGSISVAGRRSVGHAGQRLVDLEHRLGLLDPVSLLARGWSVTRTEDGVLVMDPEMVSTGTGLLTTVSGGTIRSVVSDDDEEVGRG
jgi:exodeoxyribonuclease VII large subunit